MRTNVLSIVLVAISILFLVGGILNIQNQSFSTEVDSMANSTVLVYNINRDSIETDWKGGLLYLDLNGSKTEVYLNRDILSASDGVFADDANLIFNQNCNTIQIKIDLALAKIENNLTGLYFDDEFKPLNIIQKFRCI